MKGVQHRVLPPFYRAPCHWRCCRILYTSPRTRNTAHLCNAVDQSTKDSPKIKEEDNDESQRRANERRIAAAAKISAARALARRLANEQAIAIASAKSLAGDSLDEEELELIKQSAGATSAQAAKEAAEAGAKDRKARRARALPSEQLAELARIKEENEALQKLVMDFAADKEAAKGKIADLREQYNDLVSELPEGSLSGSNGAFPSDVQLLAEAGGDKPAPPSSKPDQAEDEEHEEADIAPPPPPPTLRELAEAATEQGDNVFYFPETGIPIGGQGRLLYNRAGSPLQGDGPLQLKAGINKWQSIQVYNLQRDDELRELRGTNWWAVDLHYEDDIFQVDYVLVDQKTSIVDNNRGKDYHLPLANALTEKQILQRNAELLAELEQARHKMLEEEEERLWQEQREAAYKMADEARKKFRQHFEESLWQEAVAEATKQRENLTELSRATQQEWEGKVLWRVAPAAGKRAVLLYNKDSSSIRHQQGVIAHCGFDAWFDSQVTQIPLSRISAQEKSLVKLPDYGEWWQGSIEIPNAAQQLDFVLSDSNKRAWDNNSNEDFHVAVKNAISKEKHVEGIFNQNWKLRQEELKVGEDNAAKRTIRNMEEKAKAERKRRDLQRHIVYTEPPTPRAGKVVKLYYNPDVTALRGRPEIWVRGSFNRRQHAKYFGPLKMEPLVRGGNGFHVAELQVPKDAWMIDFSVSDAEAGGGSFTDNNGGMDYHIDVSESLTQAQPLNVVHVAVEMAPIAKISIWWEKISEKTTRPQYHSEHEWKKHSRSKRERHVVDLQVGGMADVVTALGRAVQEAGHKCTVFLPKYDVLKYSEISALKEQADFWCNGVQVKVWKGIVEELETIFLEPCNGSVWAGCIYGRNDDAARFGFFCSAVAEYLKHHHEGPKPDIVHTHDWQSAPVCFSDVHPAKSIFTIHNMEFRVDMIGRAVGSSAISTTVSPTYATEISGHPAIAPHLGKFYGIRNGIDQEIWDPFFDKFLPANFNHENVAEGKAAAKAELRKRMDLSSADVPLVSVVTRLTHQKGIHLIKHAAWRTLERGGQFVLLGSAPDARVQNEFNQLAAEIGRQYPDRARFWFAYDEPLSHLIYAGSDAFLVPSMFEPCGLTQMIAMRYGTIPVVRKTGGLNDTVFDVDDDVERAENAGMEPNGFSFVGADAAGLDYALNRALEVWYTDKELWQTLTTRVMQQDWSWAEPAFDYIEIYHKAIAS